MTRIVNKIRMIAGERTNVSKELILRAIITKRKKDVLQKMASSQYVTVESIGNQTINQKRKPIALLAVKPPVVLTRTIKYVNYNHFSLMVFPFTSRPHPN